MIQQDQMFRLLSLRYAPKLATKTKKQASYMTKPVEQEKEIPLEEAIELKCDSTKMEDQYHPRKVEKYWNSWWELNKFYQANNKSEKPKFTIMLPPPNVTGFLHIGHALTVAIEDSIVRNRRMRGYETLFLPGTDHAGIATQTVSEKKLKKQTGKNRHDLGRQKFIDYVWEYKDIHGKGIINQLKRTGCSMDWSREAFTMDEKLSRAVKEGFVRLFDMGLIYRANRLVNWSTTLKSAISDIQVEYMDIEKRTLVEVPGYEKKVQVGVIVYFKYQLKSDPSKTIEVATTRLETMLGDTGVAVHPNDPRYKEWIGKELIHPFIPQRKMIVVADEMVEIEFGTGAVKITPAHDPNDYGVGQRHKMPFINILTDDGLINQNGGKFKGQKRFQCRRTCEQQLKKIGLLGDKKDNKMRIGFCSRSHDIIQPIIKPQWYVKCTDIGPQMMEVVKTKQLQILPVEEEETWYRWIGGLRDWCISRQLWWGHRIPAFFCYPKGTEKPSESTSTENWIVARNLEEASEKAQKKFGKPKEQLNIEQDEDVLDTWFSSGLFPFSTIGWPDVQDPDFKAFFPNQLLQTGHDILFFWVARMVMMSIWLCKKLPFKEVLLHPMVCDADGQKMSKSRGNVIDPLEVADSTSLDNLVKKIEESNLPKGQKDKSIVKLRKQYPEGFPECGTDALRFGLLSYMIQSRSINLNIKKIISLRQFCNKIWNTFKFCKPKFQLIKDYDPARLNPSKQNFINSWILARLDKTLADINRSFKTYTLGEAATSFYQFWLYELCDIYLEATKPIFAGNNAEEKELTAFTLFTCLEKGLRAAHPMMPFLTEELYQKLPQFPGKAKSISIAQFPEPLDDCRQYFADIEKNFEKVNKIAGSFRSIAASFNLPPQIKAPGFIMTNESIVKQQTVLLATLGKCVSVEVIEDQSKIQKGCGLATIGSNKIFLYLGKAIDFKKQCERLEKKIDELQVKIQNLDKKIQDKNRDKIPEKVRKEQDKQMEESQKQKQSMLHRIEEVKKMF